jgi:hypothetical protein
MKVPMKSIPASAQRFLVIEYSSITFSPEICAMGEKNRWAPLGSEFTHDSSSKKGMPCKVPFQVFKTECSVVSSGRMN